MKTKLTSALLGLLAFFAVAPSAQAQIELSTSVFVGSPYVWRGEVLSTGWVFQPAISASYGGFSATYFANIDPNGTWLSSDKFHLQESDITLAYGASMGNVSIGAGYTFYTFPTPSDSDIELLPTQEVFGSLSLDGGVVVPSLFVAYDFDESDDQPLQGLYAEAKLGYDANLGGQTYSLGAALGLDSGYVVADDDTELSHVALTAGTEFSAGSISFVPMLGFQLGLSDTYKGNYGNTFFYGGFAIGF